MIFSNIQSGQIKFSKFPDKLAEEIPQNTLFVDLIYAYLIHSKLNKEDLILKAVKIIDHIMGWF